MNKKTSSQYACKYACDYLNGSYKPFLALTADQRSEIRFGLECVRARLSGPLTGSQFERANTVINLLGHLDQY
jgi:hypothetical protein